MSVTFRLATEADARRVGALLRPVDRTEIERAGTGNTPELAPLVGVQQSLISWAAVNAEGDAIAIFGVAPHTQPGIGVVWLLATPESEHETRAFVHAGRYYVDLMERLFPVLLNTVDADNVRTRRWLRALGFTEDPKIITSQSGHPFILVEKQSRHHV